MPVFSPERLFKIRRLRKARRLWNQVPLFALNTLQTDYPDYDEALLHEDIKRRTPKKKKKGKNPLRKYGRFTKMQELMQLFEQTQDPAYYLKAMKIKEVMTKPYRVKFKITQQVVEYSFDPLIPYACIEDLVSKGNKCRTFEEVDLLCNTFINNHSIKKGDILYFYDTTPNNDQVVFLESYIYISKMKYSKKNNEIIIYLN